MATHNEMSSDHITANAHNDDTPINRDHKLSVLAAIAAALNAHNIRWAVGASLLLFFKGLFHTFNDIDLLVHEEDAQLLKKVFLEELRIPKLGHHHDERNRSHGSAPSPSSSTTYFPPATLAPPLPPSPQYKTRLFMEFTVAGVDVDVMAGFVIVDADGVTHECAFYADQIVEYALLVSSLPSSSLPPQTVKSSSADAEAIDDDDNGAKAHHTYTYTIVKANADGTMSHVLSGQQHLSQSNPREVGDKNGTTPHNNTPTTITTPTNCTTIRIHVPLQSLGRWRRLYALMGRKAKAALLADCVEE